MAYINEIIEKFFHHEIRCGQIPQIKRRIKKMKIKIEIKCRRKS